MSKPCSVLSACNTSNTCAGARTMRRLSRNSLVVSSANFVLSEVTRVSKGMENIHAACGVARSATPQAASIEVDAPRFLIIPGRHHDVRRNIQIRHGAHVLDAFAELGSLQGAGL